VRLYAITDRKLFSSREALLQCVALWAEHAVDYVQIREKGLGADEMAALATEIVQTVRKAGTHTRVLLNGPAEIAAATGCDGIHLPSGMPDGAIAEVCSRMQTDLREPVISVSCHAIGELQRARDEGASLALFAPIFEKRLPEGKISGQGLQALAAACTAAAPLPVFALGGVDEHNAQACIDAGAVGIAAIRLFTADGWRHLL